MGDKRKMRIVYPSSEKVYVSGEINKIKVGMRRIKLTDTITTDSRGEEIRKKNNPVIVYDTSGPFSDSQVVIENGKGIPRFREEWYSRRKDIIRPNTLSPVYRVKPGKDLTQMYYAKRRVITPEMEYAAIRENQQIEDLGLKSYITPDFVRKEIAAGRAVIPSNINHPEAEPMIIGQKFLVKINTTLSNPLPSSYTMEKEIERIAWCCKWGSDTFMDLSTGKNRHKSRERLVRNCPAPFGTVPLYQALDKVDGNVEELSWDIYRSTLIEQAEQGVDIFTIHAAMLREHIEPVFPRLNGIVSHGGSIMSKWMQIHQKENFIYTHFAEICEIVKTYDVIISIADGLRPGAVYDANDAAQMAELRVMGKLTDIAWKQFVQVMTESSGHLPMNKIPGNVKERQYACHNAPLCSCGPVTTDAACGGYEYIASAIGAAQTAWQGTSLISCATPDRHSIIAHKIAAHAADLAKGHPGAQVRDNALSKARFESRKKDAQNLSFDPEQAAKYL
ncbi:MAG: phosphomethylpyrimidine synthase ThiC [Tannerellaceae bacterium]|jgi:phosphomethylpyrimidine synthase|nr:phosphomethylpyrimidine synthase ThiC [Tannerellaceae bacterium]